MEGKENHRYLTDPEMSSQDVLETGTSDSRVERDIGKMRRIKKKKMEQPWIVQVVSDSCSSVDKI